jgi:hypothetical protein
MWRAFGAEELRILKDVGLKSLLNEFVQRPGNE